MINRVIVLHAHEASLQTAAEEGAAWREVARLRGPDAEARAHALRQALDARELVLGSDLVDRAALGVAS
jgi:hypothetical protein